MKTGMLKRTKTTTTKKKNEGYPSRLNCLYEKGQTSDIALLGSYSMPGSCLLMPPELPVAMEVD